MQPSNAVQDTSLGNPLLTWGVGAVGAVILLVSTLELSLFRGNLTNRALVMFPGLVLAAIAICRLVPGGVVDHRDRRRLLFAVMAIHVIATLYFFPLTDILNDRPVVTLDHSFHYYQAQRARDVFWETFRLDHYDPYFMAGYPGGTIFDLDMKGASVFCAFTPVISVARALKLFILLAYLSMVPVMYWGSRMQGFKIPESVLGLLVFLAYWHWGRPYAGDFRYAGMFSFVFATHLCFLIVGLLRQVTRRAFVKTFLGIGPIAFLIHPTAIVTLPVPFAVSIGLNRRSWGVRKWVLLVAWCVGVVLINILWLEPFFKYVWMKTTTEVYYQIEGWQGLKCVLCKPSCLVALAIVALAFVGTIRAAIERRLSVALPAAAAAVFLFFIAGEGIHLPGISQLEPGRFLFGAFVFLAPLAGVGAKFVVDSGLSVVRSQRFRRHAWTATIVVLVLMMVPLSLLESKSYFRHTLKTTLRPEVSELVEAITSRVHAPGRLMIEDCDALHYGDVHLPAMLPLRTGVEQIGGPYPHTYLLYYFTSFRWEETFGKPMNQWDLNSLKPYLELYDVRWIVTASARSTEFMEKLLDRAPSWSQTPYALWTVGDTRGPGATDGTDLEASDTRQRGSQTPRVTAVVNRIEISGDPRSEGYFIEYHWVPGLTVSGDAHISPVHRFGDPVPFIYVEPNGESDITIKY